MHLRGKSYINYKIHESCTTGVLGEGKYFKKKLPFKKNYAYYDNYVDLKAFFINFNPPSRGF